MPEFQVSQEMWDGLQQQLAALLAHQHTGIDSLQINYADLLNVQYHSVVLKKTLTAAQVKALHTTPVTLITAPGGGGIILVDSIDAKLTYNSAAYTGANALEFRYTDGSGTKVTADMSTTFLNSSATAYDHVSGIVTELVPVANKPLVVAVPTADPGAGTSPITFLIKHRIISF